MSAPSEAGANCPEREAPRNGQRLTIRPLEARRGTGKAIIALARKLLGIIYGR